MNIPSIFEMLSQAILLPALYIGATHKKMRGAQKHASQS